SAPHLVTDDGIADGTPHDEARERIKILVITTEQVQDDRRPSGAASAPDGQRELVTPPHPVTGGQHAGSCVRPRSARGPCGAARPGSRGRRGYAYEAGSRASCGGGGC